MATPPLTFPPLSFPSLSSPPFPYPILSPFNGVQGIIPENFLILQMLVSKFYSILDTKNNTLIHLVFCPLTL